MGRLHVQVGRGERVVRRTGNHRLQLHRLLGNVGVDELAAHHGERPEAARHAVVELIEILCAIVRLEGADLGRA